MEKGDLSFKNFVSMFFKNLTFNKITEDDIIDNKTDYYQNSNTDSYKSKGGKYNINDDILKLKLEIPSNVSSQFDDLKTKFDKIVKKSDNLIPEIQKQLEEKKNNYLNYGGISDEPINDELDFSPQRSINTESFNSETNDDSIMQQESNSTLELYNSDSELNLLSNSNEFIENDIDIKEDKQNEEIEEPKKEEEIDIEEDKQYNKINEIEKEEEITEKIDNEINSNDNIEKQIIDLYEPFKNKLKIDTKVDLELNKKLVLLSNDLDPYKNLLKNYKKSEQKEITKDDKVLTGGIEKINLVNEYDLDYNEKDNIVSNDSEDELESENNNEIIDNNDNEVFDNNNNEIESEKDNYIENVNTETDDNDLMQSSNSIDPDYAKEIITNVIEDQQNENRKIRFGF